MPTNTLCKMALEKIAIIDGPSREELFAALMVNGGRITTEHTLRFTGIATRRDATELIGTMVIPDDFPIDFQVGLNGLQYEDGSGQSFILKGHLSMLLGVTKIEHKFVEFYDHAGSHQGFVGPIAG